VLACEPETAEEQHDADDGDDDDEEMGVGRREPQRQ
jgi:hypothetical protein